MRKTLKILLVIMVILAYVESQQSEKSIATSTVGQLIRGTTYKIDYLRAYYLINVPTLDKKYLFFSLSVDPIYSHLDFSITVYKEQTQKPLRTCENDQIDSCYISRTQLTEKQTLFVVIKGGIQCDFELRSYWSDVQHLEVGTQTKFIFSKTEPRQIYLLELGDEQFQELRIIIKPQTRRYAFDNIKMYGKFGKDSLPTAQDYDFKSMTLWEDAEGVYLYKRQIKNHTMNLLLVGSTQTVYTLKYELIKTPHHDLALDSTLHDYLQKGQSYDYHINFKNKQGKIQKDEYTFRLAVFTGVVNLKFYSDKAKTKQVSKKLPFMYMGDMQYLFLKSQIEKDYADGLVVHASAPDRIATFMMDFQSRQKEDIIEIKQHIYEFLPIDKKSVLYFTVSQFKSDEQQNQIKDIRATVSLVQVYGNVSVEFRQCLQRSFHHECIGKGYLQHSSKIESQVRTLGTKKTFTLKLQESFWKQANNAEEHAVVIMIITNKQQAQSFAAIEYNIGNRLQFLREAKPIQAHLLKDEYKIYKYSCQDKGVKQLRVHFNVLHGQIEAYSFRSQPSQQEMQKPTSRVQNNLLQVNSNIQSQPVVIVVKGVQSATFSIVVQPIHQDQNYVNSITLSQQIEFKFKISPNKYQVLEIVPISSDIFFKYDSSGAVQVCPLKNNLCSQDKVVIKNHGQIVVNNFNQRSMLVQLRNPSPSKTIQVTAIYRSRIKQNSCKKHVMGTLYKEIVSPGSCFTTVITRQADFQVLIAREQMGQLAYTMLLCDKILNFANKQDGQQLYRVTAEQIKHSCVDHDQKTFSFTATGGVSKSSSSSAQKSPLRIKTSQNQSQPPAQFKVNQKIHLKYLVQYTDGRITLPDGIGYHGRDTTTQLPVRQFTYDLLNKVDTTITLSTEKKLFFLVKIVQSQHKDLVSINTNDFHLSSPSERFYYLTSIYLKVTVKDIELSKCKNCVLLIYIYSKEEVGSEVEYTVQVTQNFQHLQEGVPSQSYLPQNSKKYYGFEIKQPGTLLVQVSDNNMNCAQLYLSNDQYPDENNYVEQSMDGQLVRHVDNDQDSYYYLTVRSRHQCIYTITASLSTSDIHILKLQRGALAYANMEEGDVRYYTFRHMSMRPLKILSLHTYGHVEIYLNKTTPQQLSKLVKKNQSETNFFQEFTQMGMHKNRLVLNINHKEFCKGCYYIIAVVAIKHTQSSLFLGDDQTPVPIHQDKVINDILPLQDDYTRGTFYYIQNVTIEAKVHSGQLQVTVTFQKQVFKTVFNRSNALQTYNFTIQEGQEFFGSASVVFKALTNNTVYSSRVRSQQSAKENDEQDGTKIIDINPSESNYVYIPQHKKTCLKGHLKRSNEKLFLSFYLDEALIVKQLRIQGFIDDKSSKIQMDTTRNVVAVSFLDIANATLKTAVQYQLCIEGLNKSLTIVVMQTEQTSLLPQNTEMVVDSKQTYDLYPEGEFMLDVFQCRGQTKVAYGNSRKQLENSKPKMMDMIGMPEQPHALKINSVYGNILLQIEGPLSLVRWLPIRVEKQQGVGYYVYAAGTVKYDAGFGALDFYVEPIKSKLQTNTKIIQINYHLYVSTKVQQLNEAVQCELYLESSVMQFNIAHQQIAPAPFKFTVDKNTLKQKYGESANLFFNVVADLTLLTPEGRSEEYRFIYKEQEVPAALFMPNTIESFNMDSMIVFLVVLIIAMVIFTWACTKVIVPMIARLRNSLLVEEGPNDNSKDKQEGQDYIQPPASSDRQGIYPADVLPTTQNKMQSYS